MLPHGGPDEMGAYARLEPARGDARDAARPGADDEARRRRGHQHRLIRRPGDNLHDCQEYAVAKAGVVRFTTCLAQLHAAIRVRVNCICPGLADSAYQVYTHYTGTGSEHIITFALFCLIVFKTAVHPATPR